MDTKSKRDKIDVIVVNPGRSVVGENSNDGRKIKIVVGDNTNNGVKYTSKNNLNSIIYNTHL
jgi:hypothetical protein